MINLLRRKIAGLEFDRDRWRALAEEYDNELMVANHQIFNLISQISGLQSALADAGVPGWCREEKEPQ